MKNLLTGVMLDVAIGPHISPGGIKVVLILAILAAIVAIIIMTWKIIQNMKKK